MCSNGGETVNPKLLSSSGNRKQLLFFAVLFVCSVVPVMLIYHEIACGGEPYYKFTYLRDSLKFVTGACFFYWCEDRSPLCCARNQFEVSIVPKRVGVRWKIIALC